MSMMPKAAQGPEVSYELHTIGWKAFQDLCLKVASVVLHHEASSFLSSQDGGRDGAIYGTIPTPGGPPQDGACTIQCKYSSKDRTLRVRDISDELEKAKKLAERGLADTYVLMTNMSVTGPVEEKVRGLFLKQGGIRQCHLYGREWITQRIREEPKLRILIPRIYGLGDLSQILDERARAQASSLLHTPRRPKRLLTGGLFSCSVSQPQASRP
jgi:hypothetical protein